MNDRELLERAAKAAGVQLGWNYSERPGGLQYSVDMATGLGWNPLILDGDALRLAVHLGIGVQSHSLGEGYSLADAGSGAVVELHSKSGDPLAATRRAIVRAAAAMAEPPLAAPSAPADWDSIALEAAREIALMWGQDHSQFVSRIQVRVLDAMLAVLDPPAAPRTKGTK